MPNILLLVVVLINIYFMAIYIKDNDLGKFLSTTGTIFVVLGVLIFIFFLSIDPGYGWIKSIDLTKNYIMIFVSIAVGIMGVVLIISGQQLHEVRIDTLTKQSRCKDILAGQAAKVMRNEWFRLLDRKQTTSVACYLFQNKSNRNNYKIIATLQSQNSMQTIARLIVSSELLDDQIIVETNKSVCPGVFEQDIIIDYEQHQKINEKVSFSLDVQLNEKWFSEEGSPARTKNIQFNLMNVLQGEETDPASSFSIQPEGYGDRLLAVNCT